MSQVGRPTDFTLEYGDKICSLIAEGNSVRSICLREDMPSMQTVFTWLRVHKIFLEQYERAKEQSAYVDEESLDETGDKAIEMAQIVDPKVAGAVVSAYKLKADNLKWSMSKKKPKKYGDKLDLTSGGEKLPTPIYNGISTKPEEI